VRNSHRDLAFVSCEIVANVDAVIIINGDVEAGGLGGVGRSYQGLASPFHTESHQRRELRWIKEWYAHKSTVPGLHNLEFTLSVAFKLNAQLQSDTRWSERGVMALAGSCGQLTKLQTFSREPVQRW